MAWPREEAEVRARHDALFKSVFSMPEHAASLLAAHLPPELVDRLDFDSLTLEPGSFVDEKLRDFHTDLLFSVNLGAEEALLYLLVEHQSSVDPMMAFRVLEYTVKVWSAWLKNHEGARRLPPVIPLIVYHGPYGWSARTQVLELVDLPAPLIEPLRDYLPSQRFLLRDLSKLDRTGIEALPTSELVRLTLFMLQNGRSETLIQDLRKMSELIAGGATRDARALEALFRYAMTINSAPAEAFVDELVPALVPKAKEVVVTAAQQLREEGRDEGREEGELKGMARVLANQIELRFGLEDGVTQRLATASAETLDRWSKAILTAKTLAELFDDDE